MRALPLAIAVLSLSATTACTPGPAQVSGQAGPAGAVPPPSATPMATTPSTPAATSAPASVPPSVAPSAVSPGGSTGTPSRTTQVTAPASRTRHPSRIRNTDWFNTRLLGVSFMNLGDLQFRDGMASSGPTTCAMLPGGARPVYAEFLAEEPAVAPVTEDAVILIECGRDSVDQALVPVQLSFSQRHPGGYGFIAADPRTEGDAARMTFLSYTVQDEAIVTTVRKADGATERRRYLHEGGDRWGRG